jgi:hypothetical protein
MAGRGGDFAKPNVSNFGPKYTVTVFAKGVAIQTYELYPEATGGPRAHRPAAQPRGKVTEAWFYAPVSMPDALRTAGVPLAEPAVSGQAGGYLYQDPQEYHPDAADGSFNLGREFGQARLALAATAGTALLVLMLLFAAAQLSRRSGR